MAGHKALGRGLEALFSSNPSTSKAEVAVATHPGVSAPTGVLANQIREIALNQIKPNRHQPRTEFDLAARVGLVQSIRWNGLAQPLNITETATPGEYELVAVDRRSRAA